MAIAIALTAAAPAAGQNLGTAGGFTYVKKMVRMKDGFVSAKVNAKCPGKKQVSVGGGSEIDAPGALDQSFISSSSGFNPGGWFTSGYHTDIPVKAKLTSWAVCAKSAKGVKKYKNQLDAGFPGTAAERAECKRGAPVSGGFRVPDPKDWLWVASANVDDPNGWQSTAYHTDVEDSRIDVDVTCMQGVMPSYPGGPLTTDTPTATRVVGCRNRETVVGGIFGSSGGGAQAHVVESQPVDLLNDKDKVPDDAWRVTFSNNSGGTLSFYMGAVCL